MDSVHRGLVLFDRPDLSTPLMEVVEWRVKAHDGHRLWGLRGQSPFCAYPRRAILRLVEAVEFPEIRVESLIDGCVEFVYQVPPGRRLEDRVMDLLRLRQVVAASFELDADQLDVCPSCPDQEPDEIMIAGLLLEEGLG